jgi:Protein of unknown function (DUF2865)
MTFRHLLRVLSALALLGSAPAALAQDVFEDTTAATTPQATAPASQQQLYCRQLERQLGPGWQQAVSARDLMPRIEAQMAKADQQFRRGQAAADQSDCYDYFLFSKTWRETAQCNQIRGQIEGAQRTLADLNRQRQQAGAAQDQTSRTDALVAELARNRCGPQYETAALHRNDGVAGNFWNDGEGLAPGAGGPNFGAGILGVPGSTYRTICVRMCDGYYFPINFATTEQNFSSDEETCQRQCGAPVKLYYYPNPGGEVQQAVALDGTPYTSLRNAFRYRKELVKSCSCHGPVDGAETTAETQPLQQDGTAAEDLGWTVKQGTLPDAVIDPNALMPLPVDKPRKLSANKGKQPAGPVSSQH